MTKDSNTTIRPKGYKNAVQSMGYAAAYPTYPLNPPLSTVVRDLGVHLDSQLSMKHHVAKVAASCHYHLDSSIGSSYITRHDYTNSIWPAFKLLLLIKS